MHWPFFPFYNYFVLVFPSTMLFDGHMDGIGMGIGMGTVKGLSMSTVTVMGIGMSTVKGLSKSTVTVMGMGMGKVKGAGTDTRMGTAMAVDWYRYGYKDVPRHDTFGMGHRRYKYRYRNG